MNWGEKTALQSPPDKDSVLMRSQQEKAEGSHWAFTSKDFENEKSPPKELTTSEIFGIPSKRKAEPFDFPLTKKHAPDKPSSGFFPSDDEEEVAEPIVNPFTTVKKPDSPENQVREILADLEKERVKKEAVKEIEDPPETQKPAPDPVPELTAAPKKGPESNDVVSHASPEICDGDETCEGTQFVVYLDDRILMTRDCPWEEVKEQFSQLLARAAQLQQV